MAFAEQIDEDAFLDTEQAAKLLGVSKALLVKMRFAGGSCPYIKIGRLVRYRRSDLLAWAAERMRISTSEKANV